MKKYRLKQWYPSLPAELKVGNIVEFNGVDSIRVEIREKYEFTEYNWEFNGLELECTQYWELIEEKKPLFITEDGVEVSDKSKNVISIDAFFNKCTFPAQMFINENREHGQFKAFYHESNANEYIWENKRVFSYEDIYTYLKHSFLDIERMNLVEQHFRKLAKERSKQ